MNTGSRAFSCCFLECFVNLFASSTLFLERWTNIFYLYFVFSSQWQKLEYGGNRGVIETVKAVTVRVSVLIDAITLLIHCFAQLFVSTIASGSVNYLWFFHTTSWLAVAWPKERMPVNCLWRFLNRPLRAVYSWPRSPACPFGTAQPNGWLWSQREREGYHGD